MVKSTARIITFLIVLISTYSFSQIVNIENKRFLNDTNGWVGNTDFSFVLIQNTQQVMQFSNTLRLQYQKNRSRFLLLNDINFVKAGNNDFVNAGFQHFRYSYKASKHITFEAFMQTQYNPVLKLDFRYLVGVGPRLKLLKKEKARVYFASLYMYEYDDIVGEAVSLYEHRLSSYLTCTFDLTKHIEFVSTVFYQPNLQDVSDYRIANDSQLEFLINKHLAFKSGFNLLYDTKQPIGIPNLVYTFRNTLSIKF